MNQEFTNLIVKITILLVSTVARNFNLVCHTGSVLIYNV